MNNRRPILEIPSELKTISKAMKSLRRKGIIRTKNLVGELGEYYCRELFGVELHGNVVQKGFDGFDKAKKRVEIKTRRTPQGKGKIIFSGFDFHYCLYVELDDNYEPAMILKVMVGELKRNLDKKGDRLSVSKIKQTTHKKVYPFSNTT